MITDALLNFTTTSQSLTGIGAGATGVSDTIDLSQNRDIATSKVPISVTFTTLPTSATAGATLNIAVQTSADGVTWTTIEETGAQPIANYTPVYNQFAFRGWLAVGVQRFLRLAYTPSAALTAGAVFGQLGGDWPRSKAYPRSYQA